MPRKNRGSRKNPPAGVVGPPAEDLAPILKKEPKAARSLSDTQREPPAAADVNREKPGDSKRPAPRPVAPEVEGNVNKSLAPVYEPTARKSVLKDARVERVIATRQGYYGHKVRQEGEVFDMYLGEKGFLPSWVRLATEDEIEKRFVPDTDEEGNEVPQKKGTEVPVLNDSRPYSEGGNSVRPRTGVSRIKI